MTSKFLAFLFLLDIMLFLIVLNISLKKMILFLSKFYAISKMNEGRLIMPKGEEDENT